MRGGGGAAASSRKEVGWVKRRGKRRQRKPVGHIRRQQGPRGGGWRYRRIVLTKGKISPPDGCKKRPLVWCETVHTGGIKGPEGSGADLEEASKGERVRLIVSQLNQELCIQ